jgi:hypothetical protein
VLHAAECLALYYLPLIPEAVGAHRKAEVVETVLGWLEKAVGLPSEWEETFASGLWHPGAHCLTRPDVQFTFLLEFLRAFKQLPSEVRDKLAADRWEFKRFTCSVELHSGYTMGETLLHVVVRHIRTHRARERQEKDRRPSGARAGAE